MLISEYIEGSRNNKAIELHNPSEAAVDLGAESYVLEFYFNGNTAPRTIILTGTVAAKGSYVIADNGSVAGILAVANQVEGGTFFNGNDAIVLRKSGTVIDSLGQIGFDPGEQWGSGAIATKDKTLRRIATVLTGDAIATDPFNPSLEWEGYAQDTFNGLGVHTTRDETPPTLRQINPFTPVDDSADIAIDTALSLQFDESIQRGTGALILRRTADGLVIESFDIADSNRISISESSLTLDPSSDLEFATDYHIEIEPGAVKDLAGNSFAGFVNTTTWNFTTVSDPTPPPSDPVPTPDLTEPEPNVPESPNSEPVDPNPTEPNPTESNSDNPQPIEPDPVEPNPTESDPSILTPVESERPGANFGDSDSPSSPTIGSDSQDSDSGLENPVSPSSELNRENLLGSARRDIPFARPRSGIFKIGMSETDVLRGTPQSDKIQGGQGNDRLFGGSKQNGHGQDHLLGNRGDDWLWGGKGKDRLDGGQGDDVLIGGKNRDLCIGGNGRDRLLGQGGNDILIGGQGDDRLSGGQGRDMFTYTSLKDGTDTILKFNVKQDLIDLRQIFTTPAFSGESFSQQLNAYVDWVQIGSSTQVRIDADGSGTGQDFVTLAVLRDVNASEITSQNYVIS